MGDHDSTPHAILEKRWLRDPAKSQESDEGSAHDVFLPEDQVRARRILGFELRQDGSYLDVGSGANDAYEVEPTGTWRIDGEGRLVLHPHKGKGAKRTFRIRLELIEE